MTAPAAARKNQYGARVYPVPRPGTLDVEELTSVTQMLQVIAAPGLEKWKQGIIAEQFSLRPDLIMLAANPATRSNAIKQALDATQSSANTGTAVHHFSEAIDDGTFSWELVPEIAKPWVDNYLQAKTDYGWEMVRKEFTVYCHRHRYAGTADRFLRIPGYPGVVVADLKTGKGVYGDHGLQMACYAFAEGIWVAPEATPKTDAAMAELADNIKAGTNVPPNRRGWSQAAIKAAEAEIQEDHWREYSELGRHEPMPEDLRKDVAFVLHLRDDKFELIPLDISGMEDVVAGVAALNNFQKRRNIVGKSLTPGQSAPAAPVQPAPAVDTDTSQPVVTVESDTSVSLEPATEIPVVPVVRSVQVFRDRITALSPPAKQKLAFNWPADVPTFKRSSDHTDEQLLRIDNLLWNIECEFPPDTKQEASALHALEHAFAGSITTN